MSGGDVFAFCALVLGVICVSAMLVDAYKRRLRFREAELEAQARIVEAQAAGQAQRAGELEERLRVLERIATDKGAALAERIEDLRREPAN